MLVFLMKSDMGTASGASGLLNVAAAAMGWSVSIYLDSQPRI
jgi:hypothetical protein